MNRRLILWLAGLAVCAAGPARGARFEELFTGATMRLELRQIGEGEGSHISVERLRAELLWPGSRTRLVDTVDRGELLFEVFDLASGQTLYSRGHASHDDGSRRLHRSFRFPEPRAPFRARLSRRGSDRSFEEVWSAAFDPGSHLVDRSELERQYAWTLVEQGYTLHKVDLLFLGEGYTAAELPRYHADVGRLLESLLSHELFAPHREAFNARVIDTPSRTSGIHERDSGEGGASALGGALESADSGGVQLHFDEAVWREVAAVMPYDFVVILVNSDQDLSAGSYQELAAVAASSPTSAALLAREFARHYADLDPRDDQQATGEAEDRSAVIESMTRLYTQ